MDHALQCKTITQDLIFFAIDHCGFLSHRGHNVNHVPRSILFAP